ncbi:MAG: glutamate--tRNA ligase, partial [Candidatus Magasanikbacteria bacterium CG10_big_fil_rev_8_21_14_0_10_40_10]
NDWTEEKLTAKTGEWISQNSLSNGEILWPLRVALSGQKNSPGPLAIAEVLGQEKTLQRIKQAADKL